MKLTNSKNRPTRKSFHAMRPSSARPSATNHAAQCDVKNCTSQTITLSSLTSSNSPLIAHIAPISFGAWVNRAIAVKRARCPSINAVLIQSIGSVWYDQTGQSVICAKNVSMTSSQRRIIFPRFAITVAPYLLAFRNKAINAATVK